MWSPGSGIGRSTNSNGPPALDTWNARIFAMLGRYACNIGVPARMTVDRSGRAARWRDPFSCAHLWCQGGAPEQL
jgi:hypothetical protein